MSNTEKLPKTLLEAVQYFSDSRHCVEFVKNLHWPDGKVTCPRCDSEHVKELSTRQIWKCYGCKKQFSAKVGTIFEQSPLSLSKWLPAMWLICNAKNGVSSCEIARSIGVCQKTAWFMMHRIREALQNGSFLTKLSGVVEADETFVGGLEKNKHISQNKYKKAGVQDKTIVFGMLERGGEVRAKVVDSRRRHVLEPEVRANIEAGSTLYTDSLQSYSKLKGDYSHDYVDHAREYVKGTVHTNSMEGFWSLTKRMLKGTYIHVAPFHLDRYLTEQSFRYNFRKGDDLARFETSVSRIFGRRLTYAELTGTCQ